jgi:hypothetical protein
METNVLSNRPANRSNGEKKKNKISKYQNEK